MIEVSKEATVGIVGGLLTLAGWLWAQFQKLHGRITENQATMAADFVRKDDFNNAIADIKTDVRQVNQSLSDLSSGVNGRLDQIIVAMGTRRDD